MSSTPRRDRSAPYVRKHCVKESVLQFLMGKRVRSFQFQSKYPTPKADTRAGRNTARQDLAVDILDELEQQGERVRSSINMHFESALKVLKDKALFKQAMDNEQWGSKKERRAAWDYANMLTWGVFGKLPKKYRKREKDGAVPMDKTEPTSEYFNAQSGPTFSPQKETETEANVNETEQKDSEVEPENDGQREAEINHEAEVVVSPEIDIIQTPDASEPFFSFNDELDHFTLTELRAESSRVSRAQDHVERRLVQLKSKKVALQGRQAELDERQAELDRSRAELVQEREDMFQERRELMRKRPMLARRRKKVSMVIKRKSERPIRDQEPMAAKKKRKRRVRGGSLIHRAQMTKVVGNQRRFQGYGRFNW